MVTFLSSQTPDIFVCFQKCTLIEEDMMDAMQTAQPAQSSTELTELGKCLLKHEVGFM